MGSVEVPEDAYYGAFTARAKENFQITGEEPHEALIRALGQVKQAAARANQDLDLLDADTADAIEEAAGDVVDGEMDTWFVLDPFQAGAGTPWHMNANEVLANRATELLGGDKGDYRVHPNDHVNMGQSTNNVIPTAVRIAALDLLDNLREEVAELADALEQKADAYDDVVKVGRTHLQDAVPVTLGQEFHAWATLARNGMERVDRAAEKLRVVGLGGNAVGTGINTPPAFRETVVEELSTVTGRELEPAEDGIAMTQSMTPFAALGSALKTLAVDGVKVADDLMLLSSGPVAGLHELELPEVEPGSSIMPGKVNPSIVEAFKMACLQVQGNAHTVDTAAQEGDLEMNVNAPLIARNLFDALTILTNSVRMLRERCVEGIEPDEKRIQELFQGSTATATALSPYLGYDTTAAVVQQALEEERSIRDVVVDEGLLTEEEADQVLDPARMTTPSGVDKAIQETVRERMDDRV